MATETLHASALKRSVMIIARVNLFYVVTPDEKCILPYNIVCPGGSAGAAEGPGVEEGGGGQGPGDGTTGLRGGSPLKTGQEEGMTENRGI